MHVVPFNEENEVLYGQIKVKTSFFPKKSSFEEEILVKKLYFVITLFPNQVTTIIDRQNILDMFYQNFITLYR